MIKPNAIPILRVADRIIASDAFKAWIANGGFAGLDPPKKGLERQFNPYLHIVQNLTMNLLQGGALGFPTGQEGLGVVQPKRRTRRMCVAPHGKGVVIHPLALGKLVFENTPLAVRKLDSVSEGFSHPRSIAHCTWLNRQDRL